MYYVIILIIKLAIGLMITNDSLQHCKKLTYEIIDNDSDNVNFLRKVIILKSRVASLIKFLNNCPKLIYL